MIDRNRVLLHTLLLLYLTSSFVHSMDSLCEYNYSKIINVSTFAVTVVIINCIVWWNIKVKPTKNKGLLIKRYELWIETPNYQSKLVQDIIYCWSISKRISIFIYIFFLYLSLKRASAFLVIIDANIQYSS